MTFNPCTTVNPAHHWRRAPPGGSWARGCAPPRRSTWPWRLWKGNKSRQRHSGSERTRVGSNQPRRRRQRRLAAPSDWSRLSGRGGALEKQRSGSDPEIQEARREKKKVQFLRGEINNCNMTWLQNNIQSREKEKQREKTLCFIVLANKIALLGFLYC